MCHKCIDLDQRIERYRKLILGLSDQLAIESAQALIREAERRKAEFHPEPEER